jgi:hypothetical protein
MRSYAGKAPGAFGLAWLSQRDRGSKTQKNGHFSTFSGQNGQIGRFYTQNGHLASFFRYKFVGKLFVGGKLLLEVNTKKCFTKYFPCKSLEKISKYRPKKGSQGPSLPSLENGFVLKSKV